MTQREEHAFIQGQRSMALAFLRQAFGVLGREEITEAQQLQLERAETLLKVREICALHGDNDWEDGLHLADVLERNLLNYLEERAELQATQAALLAQSIAVLREIMQRPSYEGPILAKRFLEGTQQ